MAQLTAANRTAAAENVRVTGKPHTLLRMEVGLEDISLTHSPWHSHRLNHAVSQTLSHPRDLIPNVSHTAGEGALSTLTLCYRTESHYLVLLSALIVSSHCLSCSAGEGAREGTGRIGEFNRSGPGAGIRN